MEGNRERQRERKKRDEKVMQRDAGIFVSVKNPHVSVMDSVPCVGIITDSNGGSVELCRGAFSSKWS